MYRQQFPDAPGLFSANQRRGIKTALKRNWDNNFVPTSLGIGISFLGMLLLLWNESTAVQTARSLDEGNEKVIVPETTDVVFEENEGKLVLLSGPLRVQDSLADLKYGISIRAVKLRKKVQMYQWYEHEDRLDLPGGAQEADHDGHVETTYSYRPDWFDHLIDSSDFDSVMGHHNPEEWPFNSSMVLNTRVKVGDFLLGNDLKEKFTSFTVFTSDERPADRSIKMHAGLYFIAQDVWKHEIGDVRIQFSYAGRDGEQFTVVGRQSGREIRPYRTESGDELLLLHDGLLKPGEVFHREHIQTRAQIWIYRLCGLFFTFLGANCCGDILEILVMELPAFRGGFVLGYLNLPLVSSMVSVGLGISLSWIRYRPTFGGSILFLSVFPTLLGILQEYRYRNRTKKYRYQ